MALRTASAENSKLKEIIEAQQEAQQILQDQIRQYESKEESYLDIDRRRRGSEMMLASLGEKQKLMESSEACVKAQLLEALASQRLVQNEIARNAAQRDKIRGLMENHKAYISAYEMRVAELESENGELHGFLTALLKDPTIGMLNAVLGFYRQRYYQEVSEAKRAVA